MPVAGLCTDFVERKDWLRPRLRPVGADRAALEAITLYDIEYRILRSIRHDPRVHCGLNGASIGYPNRAQESFTPEQRPRPPAGPCLAPCRSQVGARSSEEREVVARFLRFGPVGIVRIHVCCPDDTLCVYDETRRNRQRPAAFARVHRQVDAEAAVD